MVRSTYVFIGFAIVSIIAMLIIYRFFWRTDSSKRRDKVAVEETETGNPSLEVSSEENTCRVYRLKPHDILNDSDLVEGDLASPGNCIDTDLQQLEKARYKCLEDTCEDLFGKKVSKNESILAFRSCSSPAKKCLNDLQIIALETGCLAADQGQVVIEPCSGVKEEQLFRMLRYTPGGAVETRNGQYALFYSRVAQRCLTMIDGRIAFGQCNSLPNGGIEWYPFPDKLGHITDISRSRTPQEMIDLGINVLNSSGTLSPITETGTETNLVSYTFAV